MAIYRYNRDFSGTKAHLVIVIVTLAVTVFQFANEDKTGGFVYEALSLQLPMVWDGEWWRMLSVSLVHGGPFHIFMNLYFIWQIGQLYEKLSGPISFLAVYVVSVLGGSIACLLFGDVFTGVVGASGGGFGLMGAILAMMYARVGSVRAVMRSQFGNQLVILLLANVAISFLPSVSALGHFGGLVAGMLTGYLIERYQSGFMARLEKIGAGMLAVMLLALGVYATMPVHRGGWRLAHVMRIPFVVEEQEGLPPSSELDVWERDLIEARRLVDQGLNDIDGSESYAERRAAVLKKLAENEERLAKYKAVHGALTPAPAATD